MRLWQWVWLWLWLVGLGAIETGEKWPREQWREEGKGGEGQCPFRCWEAKPPSLALHASLHPPHPEWAFLWRARLICEKFLEQTQACP